MDYWWFIFGGITLALFLAMVEYKPDTGVKYEWYNSLEFYPGTGDPVIILLGNAFAALMFAWAAYHMFAYSNQKIVRFGAVFLMVAVFISLLVWSLALFSSHAVGNAMFFLSIGLVLLGGWIILSFWNIPDNDQILLPLVLGFIWIVYLLYFTWGIIQLNDLNDLDEMEKNQKLHKTHNNSKYHRKRRK
jgi:hypothetical protein